MARKKRNKGSADKAKFLKKLGKKFAKELAERATPWELAFKAKIEKLDIPYYFQHPVICERNYLYILDFYIPEYGIAFEIDGAHHYTREKEKEDALRTKRIQALGIQVKRIMNSNVEDITPESILQFLKRIVKK